MVDAMLLLLAQLVALCAMGWFSLSLKPHWRQVRQSELPDRAVPVLRILGSAGLLVALVLCLQADAPTMAALVWFMTVSLAGFLVAFTLSWRPGFLRPLAILF